MPLQPLFSRIDAHRGTRLQPRIRVYTFHMYVICSEPQTPPTKDTGITGELWREMLGKEIRSARTQRGDRLSDLAERSGVSPQYLSEIERGMKDPSSEMIDAIAGALGMSTLDLAKSVVEKGDSENGDVHNAASASVLLLAA